MNRITNVILERNYNRRETSAAYEANRIRIIKVNYICSCYMCFDILISNVLMLHLGLFQSKRMEDQTSIQNGSLKQGRGPGCIFGASRTPTQPRLISFHLLLSNTYLQLQHCAHYLQPYAYPTHSCTLELPLCGCQHFNFYSRSYFIVTHSIQS